MMLTDILERKIRDSVYIIAEIGQNHQGCLAVAKSMILRAKSIGCHCVKFQKSDLKAKFTHSALQRQYVSEHSWGSTYGQHKEYLEFSKEQYRELQSFSHDIGIDFTASAMDERSLAFLEELKVPFIKIGSGDANNFPLLIKASRLETPLIISTGMQNISTIDKIVEIMGQAGKDNFALMHCVSAYPVPPEASNVGLIPMFINRYPRIVIGYSGHELGIDITQAAILSGARIVERHFTLDKDQKGSDHCCSLDPQEFKSLVDRIERLKHIKVLQKNTYCAAEISNILGDKLELKEALKDITKKEIQECELPCQRKLGKTIVASRNLKKGHKLLMEDLAIKVSEPSGIPAEMYFHIIGMELIEELNEDDPVIAAVLSSVE
ncbi:sialic acid synthase [Scaptodrosophila lebanonensis]|uniref:Sialic acid synthase n=1 Tax=Drosophila lebanonensis TaxID=7225 RepID=A0A6J2T280_DROLE|nr:sialic acid synthase [Scaptodrosophila lebanonensis]